MKKPILALSIIALALCSYSSDSFAAKKSSKKTKYTVKKAEVPKQISSSSKINNAGFADIIEKVLPSVVNISGEQSSSKELEKNSIEEILENNKKLSSIGSGFIYSENGLIATNYHVIEDSDKIIVSLDDEKYEAKIVGVDKRSDLALIKISTEQKLQPIKFGDSNKTRVGDWVIVVGNPYGLGKSASIGIVSAKNRNLKNGELEEFIQTDAAINTGNSGGPMFNLNGEVIGVSNIIHSPNGGNVGVGFATPSATASQVLQQLKEDGEVTRGWIGITVQEVSTEIAQSMKIEKNKGAFVNDVLKAGPANIGGIKPADVIIKIDNHDITEMKILPKIISRYPIGEVAKITVIREGKIRILNVQVLKSPEENNNEEVVAVPVPEKRQLAAPSFTSHGLGMITINKESQERLRLPIDKGLLITEVEIGSEAEMRGIAPGDMIISANQILVSSTKDFAKAIEESQNSADKKLLLFIRRNDVRYPVTLTIKDK